MRKLFKYRDTGDESSAFKSTGYWEKRYKSGRNSGPGSYGRLAEFKADVLNEFVAKNKIASVIEWGCGDGNQLSLANYPKYLGLDVSRTSISTCLQKFSNDETKSFLLYDDALYKDPASFITADLALSLDVIFHLVENSVYERYMYNLFASARKYVIIYSSNSNTHQSAEHVKHRTFTKWINSHAKNWELKQKINNKFPYSNQDAENTSFSDFYIFDKAI